MRAQSGLAAAATSAVIISAISDTTLQKSWARSIWEAGTGTVRSFWSHGCEQGYLWKSWSSVRWENTPDLRSSPVSFSPFPAPTSTSKQRRAWPLQRIVTWNVCPSWCTLRTRFLTELPCAVALEPLDRKAPQRLTLPLRAAVSVITETLM